jgi:hypothetical protein
MRTFHSRDHRVELGYNELSLRDTSFITLYILWYQLVPLKACVFVPSLVRHTI